MEAIDLLTGYAEKLKAADKDLKRLEKASKKLSEKQAETDEEREQMEDSIAEHRREVAALHSENSDLQLTYIQSVYQQDAHAQRAAQTRRVEIETALREHTEAIDALGIALEQLPSHAEEAATVAGQLDALQWGDGFRFSRELETVLTSNQRTLESRQSDARKQLPAFSQELYREVRSNNDQDYARKQKSEAKYQETQARIQKEREERRKLTKSEVRDQDTGYLLGWNIKNENGKVVRFEKLKKVPIGT